MIFCKVIWTPLSINTIEIILASFLQYTLDWHRNLKYNFSNSFQLTRNIAWKLFIKRNNSLLEEFIIMFY